MSQLFRQVGGRDPNRIFMLVERNISSHPDLEEGVGESPVEMTLRKDRVCVILSPISGEPPLGRKYFCILEKVAGQSLSEMLRIQRGLEEIMSEEKEDES